MLTQKVRKAAAIAAVIPPVAAALLLVIFIVIGEVADGRIPSAGEISFFPFMTLIVGFVISISSCCIIGIPIHLLLQRLRLTSVFWYAGLASILTFGVTIYGTGYPNLKYTENFFIFIAVCIALGGPIAAITFWLIARPDLNQAKPEVGMIG
jgi:hypothetical protein